ncbi:MAG: type II secretion system minor pseudopilin GspI [Kangiellaceae bacterium]|nr:type II secretion system minor pseudopilin GspI [Kangiellaceae bacterium]
MKILTRKTQGLSLLELLIALAIFSIFITPVLTGLYSSSVQSVLNSKDKTLASYIAQNHLAELQLEEQWPSTGTKQGELEFANQSWRWQQKVVDTTDENLRRVIVTIEYGKDGAFTMTGFVGKKESK